MKKTKLIISITLICAFILILGLGIFHKYIQIHPSPISSEYLVSTNGPLHIKNGQLYNNLDTPFIMHGFSSSGIQWNYDILTYDNLKQLRDGFKVNAFRIAMYTEENGYIENPDKIYNETTRITDILIDLDMYVIIDWHILSDNDPNIHLEQSKDFFDKYSKKYKDSPNILYEICNEPNGLKVTWNESIKPYAETIIPIIRNNNPDSLIIVGTPANCHKFADVLENPLSESNILYACHNYVGEKGEDLTVLIDSMLNKKQPIIVTEWGLTDATGNGNLYLQEAKQWLDYLDSKNISSFNWSFSNTPNSSSILSTNYTLENNKNILNYLTDSGKFLRKLQNKK